MKAFAGLYRALDRSNATRAKLQALTGYFSSVPPEDGAWAVYFLSGERLKRLMSHAELRTAALRATAMPDWLLEETYASVGDLAETLALLIDGDGMQAAGRPLHDWVEQSLLPLRRLDAGQRIDCVLDWWRQLGPDDRFLLNKLITGGFRVGVSKRLVIRALADVAGLEPAVIAHRLMGQWTPSAAFFRDLLDPETREADASRPYPFFLAAPLVDAATTLGAAADWQIEWKWDGIRAQLLRRTDALHLWSRGEEPLDGRFPEVEADSLALPAGTVLDGELLAWKDLAPLPFHVLQKRIGRLRPGPRILAEAPVVFLAYDLLEWQGRDLRAEPLDRRRALLETLLGDAAGTLRLSPRLSAADWDSVAVLRESARGRGTEGLMLKRRSSPYRVGRVRGDWWKWKLQPLTLDVVMLYAQPGHGRRSNLYTDYTFGIWSGDRLVPIAKAYTGLDQAEIERLDRWIRKHTTERFGPVRAVEPVQVFELAFDGLAPSSRHKSGLALRFPRIHRWREDLGPNDADTVEQAGALL